MKYYPFNSFGCLGAMLAVAFPAALSAQDPNLSLVASNSSSELGSNFSSAGDINEDGVLDVAIADRTVKVDGFYASGTVYIVSGSDGSILRTYTGTPQNGQMFGAALAALDADADGVTDLAVGAPGRSWSAGGVTIYSGIDGSVISDAVGSGYAQLGASLANAGDQDGDGADDLYVGAPIDNSFRGMVYVLSGKEASVIRSVTTEAASSSFGAQLLALDDIDADGIRDLAVASPYYRIGYYSHGRLQLIRSSDNQVAAEIVGAGYYTYLGYSLAQSVDVTGDDVRDIMVGSFSGGIALVVSGADLSTVHDMTIPSFPTFRPLNVGGSLDFDSDGIEDWLLGSPAMPNPDGTSAAGVRLLSGADGSVLFEQTATTTSYTGLGQVLRALPDIGFAIGEPRLYNATTGGYGSASVWQLNGDSDGDGVPDSEDKNPYSLADPTLSILGLETDVANTVDASGVTLADRFAELGDTTDYGSETHYFVAVRQLTNDLSKNGLLDRDDMKLITAAALQTTVQTKNKAVVEAGKTCVS